MEHSRRIVFALFIAKPFNGSKKDKVCLASGHKWMGTPYRASCSFRLRLIRPPNGTDADVKQNLDIIFCPAMPARITNIEARFTTSHLSAACNASPDSAFRTLPVEGYVQRSKGLIYLYNLDRWVPNTEWTHVSTHEIFHEWKCWNGTKWLKCMKSINGSHD